MRLDAESNIEIINVDGEKTTPAEWVKSIGLDYRPGILLFNEGEQISKITGLLYKYHFGELLRYVGEGHHFEYPDSFYDYLRVRSGQIMDALSMDLPSFSSSIFPSSAKSMEMSENISVFVIMVASCALTSWTSFALSFLPAL